MNNEDYVLDYGALTKGSTMEATAIKQDQKPEIYLAADVEPYAKGGWKTVAKASIRVFDGDEAGMYIKLEAMLTSALNIARTSIEAHEAAFAKRQQEEQEGANE